MAESKNADIQEARYLYNERSKNKELPPEKIDSKAAMMPKVLLKKLRMDRSLIQPVHMLPLLPQSNHLSRDM